MRPLFNRDEADWALSWLGLAIVAIVFHDHPGLAPVIRYTLIAIAAYILLTKAEIFGPPIQRWVDRLSSAPAPARPAGRGQLI